MKKYKGLTKPIKKKLDNITRLYNFYSELCKYHVSLKFDNKFVLKDTSYMIELIVTKNEGVIESCFSLYFSEFYIMANEYIDIYRDICKQIRCVEDVIRKCC